MLLLTNGFFGLSRFNANDYDDEVIVRDLVIVIYTLI